MLQSNHQTLRASELAVVVPGLGDAIRIPVLQKSLKGLSTEQRISCIVYVWDKSLMDEATERLDECTVIYSEGLWTHHMVRVDETVLGNATHIAILIDDIDVSSVNSTSFLSTMSRAGYDAASAAVPGWHYDSIQPRKECKSHRTDFADVLFLVYTREAWRCWRQQIDLNINEFGWGYDVTFADKCNVTVGVIDDAIAVHHGGCEHGGDCTRSYDGTKAGLQQMEWILRATGRPQQQLLQYWENIVYHRPTKFPHCDEFHSQANESSSKSMSTHPSIIHSTNISSKGKPVANDDILPRRRRVILLGPHDRYNFGDLLFEKIVTKLLIDRKGYHESDLVSAGLIDANMSAFGGNPSIVSRKRAIDMSREATMTGNGGPYHIIFTGGESLGCSLQVGLRMIPGEKKSARRRTP